MSQEIVAAVRAKYPTPLGDQHPAFLLEVSAALGKGLVRKPNGTNITLPDGVQVSQDVVMLPTGPAWDILSDAEGAAEPVYNQIADIDATRYYAVAGTDPGQPPPPGDPTFEGDVRASLGRVEANQAAILASQEEMDRKLNALLMQPAPAVTFPPYVTSVLGRNVTSHPVK